MSQTTGAFASEANPNYRQQSLLFHKQCYNNGSGCAGRSERFGDFVELGEQGGRNLGVESAQYRPQ